MLGDALWKLIYAVSLCDETARRDASSEATCPKVKSAIETDSDDISVVTARTRACVSRENTYIRSM